MHKLDTRLKTALGFGTGNLRGVNKQKIWNNKKKKSFSLRTTDKDSGVKTSTFIPFKGADKTHEPVTAAFHFYALTAYYVHASVRPSDSKLCAFRSKKVTGSSVQNRPLFKCWITLQKERAISTSWNDGSNKTWRLKWAIQTALSDPKAAAMRH